MELLKELGIDPEKLSISLLEEKGELIQDSLREQFVGVVDKTFGEYWSARLKQGVKDSGVYDLVARSVRETCQVIEIDKIPNLGLANGFLIGKLKYQGYCWKDDQGETWVGLDENWFGDVVEGELNYYTQREIMSVLAEEVFHAYIRQVRPELAEENIKANASMDERDYWDSPVEQGAKEFAKWYVKESLE